MRPKGLAKRRSDASRRHDACWKLATAALLVATLHCLWWTSLGSSWRDDAEGSQNPPRNPQNPDSASSASSASREMLSVPILAHGKTLHLRLHRGDDILDTVKAFVRRNAIPEDQLQGVTESLRAQAWSLGFTERMGVRVVDESSGEVVYVELSQGDDFETRLRETGRRHGVKEAALAGFVNSAMSSLITERVVPLFSIDVELGRVKGQVRYFLGDRLEEVVRKFCEMHGVRGRAVRGIGNAVHAEAIRRRVIPSLSLHLNVQEKRTGEMSPVHLEVFYGDDLEETLGEFERKYRLTDEAASAIRGALVRQSVLKRIIPLLNVNLGEIKQLGSVPQSEMRQRYKPISKPEKKKSLDPPPQRSENLTLYAGDDFSLEVTNFLDFHGLTFGARPKLVARAERSAVVNGVKPMATLRIDLWRYESKLKEGSRAVMPIYHGMPLVESISQLGETYRLSASAQKKILTDARKVLGKQNGKSVAVLDLAYQRNHEIVPMSITVREGYNIDDIVAEACRKARVAPEDVALVHNGIVQEAVKLRVLPALSFKVDGPDGWSPLSIYAGDNMSAVVEDFVEATGMEPKHDGVFCEVVKSAIRRQLIPAASAEVMILDGGWSGPEVMYVDLHEGDDVSTAVESMGLYYDFNPKHKSAIVREVQRKLDEKYLRIPQTTVFVNLGGVNVSMPVFDREDWGPVVERAKEYPVWGEPLTEPEKSVVHDDAKEVFTELGLAPVLAFPVHVTGRGPLRFAMYVDDTLRSAVDRFLKMHGVGEGEREAVTAAAREEAVLNRLLPAFALNVTVPGGKSQLRMFAGDRLNDTVAAFGKIHGFSDKKISRLTRDVMLRAGKAKVMPVMTMDYESDGETHRLKLFQGDKIEEAAEKLATQHSILDVGKLKAALTARAQQLRLVPIQAVPFMVMSDLGVEEASISVFHGDDVDSLAKEFVTTRDLSLDADVLATIVKSQLSKEGG